MYDRDLEYADEFDYQESLAEAQWTEDDAFIEWAERIDTIKVSEGYL
ncbi:MAG: hypothetical protein WD739_09170 [Actinomycetota bacterium]